MSAHRWRPSAQASLPSAQASLALAQASLVQVGPSAQASLPSAQASLALAQASLVQALAQPLVLKTEPQSLVPPQESRCGMQRGRARALFAWE